MLFSLPNSLIDKPLKVVQPGLLVHEHNCATFKGALSGGNLLSALRHAGTGSQLLAR